MDGPLPTFEGAIELIRSPKPPLTCRVTDTSHGEAGRWARVIFDGADGWFIETAERTEFRHSGDVVMLDDGNVLAQHGPGIHVYSNGWVKTPIEGRLMSLERSWGTVLGHSEIDGRPALRVEIHGLKHGEDVAFIFDIDQETGVVLRMTREDLGPEAILRVEELRVGHPVQPPPLDPGDVASDETAILETLDALDRALNDRDPDALAALFTDDPAVTFWGSAAAEEAVGRDAIRALLASAEEPGTFTLTYDDRRVSVRGDVAWVNASGNATWERPGHDTIHMPYRFTAILVRDGDTWHWHTHHGSEPSP